MAERRRSTILPPDQAVTTGHSAGAQLAALLCTERYLQAEGLAFTDLIGCVPVDGDTYDLPAIIDTEETRVRLHGQPQPRFGHRQKFSNSAEKFREYSAVTHVAKGKGISPFQHVADHPDTTTAQALSGCRVWEKSHRDNMIIAHGK